MSLFLLAIFFIGYASLAYLFLRWQARARVAAVADPVRFGRRQRALAFLGILVLASAPPLAEMAIRAQFGAVRFNDLEFASFITAWIAATLPGIYVSRSTLRAGGINPDAE